MKISSLVIAAVLGSGSVANADVVHFVNNGEFVWQPGLLHSGGFAPGNYFDPTVSASDNGDLTDTVLDYLRVEPISSSEVTNGSIGTPGSAILLTSPVLAGDAIDSSAEFLTFLTVDAFSFSGGAVPLFANQMILGLSIQLEGETHYGWARFEWVEQSNDLFSMYQPVEWAYESEAGETIIAIPAPASVASLSMLALVGMRRRR